MTRSWIRAATLAVLVVAAVLRLVLATVNREQSDNHVDVIHHIAFDERIPDYDRDRDSPKEGFQPKLYHATVAAILRAHPSARASAPCVAAYPGAPHTVWVGQMVSAVAGILTLCVALRFLGALGLSEKARFFTFALAALNPALIAIDVQVTNDAFVILFGSLSLFWGHRFFRDFRVRDFAWMTASVVAAAMSKGTGLPIVLAVVLVFAITLAQSAANGGAGRATVARYLLVFLVALLVSCTVLAPKLGAYWEHYRRYGSPFVTNRLPEPFPRPFAPTPFTGDPGVRSIAESLFTFRIIGLLRVPNVGTGRIEDYPPHRTSLWSQVYGRLNSTRFDDYLETWRPHSPLPTIVARSSFVVALFPAALFLVGVCGALGRMVSCAGPRRPQAWLIDVAAAGSLAFLVVLALRYRDYSFFKPILAAAGLLGFLALLGQAYDRFHAGLDGRCAARAGDVVLGTLIALYALDAALLAVELLASCRTPGGFPQ